MSVQRIILMLLWLGCLTQASVRGQTLGTHKALGRYQQFVWQDQHGLPQNSVLSITRTRDGYLWLGTAEGVARFDGVRFTVFDSGNTPEIKNNHITTMLEDRAGNLWMGIYHGGVTRLTDGRFTSYTARDGLSDDYVSGLLEDRGGNLWVGTHGGGLNRFRDGRFTVYTTRDGLPDDHVRALAEDGEGGLWVGTQGGLARLKDGRFTTYTAKDGLAHNFIYSLSRDRAGNLWVGTEGGGLARFKDGRFTTYGAAEGLKPNNVRVLTEDREGGMWIGTSGGGLYRFREGRFDAYTTRDGLPNDFVTAIYQDPEGDLWVGTNGGGVSRLRDGRFRVYAAEDGLSHDSARAIYEDAAGGMWVGTDDGLNQFKDGRFTTYTTADGLPHNYVGVIGGDRAGSLWIGTDIGLCQFKDGRFITHTTAEGLSNNWVHAVLGDRAGNLWVGTNGGGLNRLRDGRFTAYTTRDGLVNDYLSSLYEDRAGNLWVGTRSGISRLKDGRFTNWTIADGLANGPVQSFHEDREGSLWIGTYGGGLHRLKDGKLTAITAKDGLYDNLAFQILEDDAGNLWMSCNKGIYRAGLQELHDFADGRIAAVTSYSYGVADGMLNREGNAAQPAGWKARDGRLWFPTPKGVVVIDPRRRNTEPPRVAIESVALDQASLPTGQTVRISPGQEKLEIQYTALSWSRPQQIRFKYQMSGLDHGWVEAGVRRTAYYSHLPPGEYTFKVIADNGEGVWNTEGQSLRVVMLPPFYRTWWFVTVVALGLAGVLVLGYQYRIRQLRRAHTAQQAFSRQLIASQEQERKRIAAGLHDSLGQQLLVIKNWAMICLSTNAQGAPNREALDEISVAASDAVNEVREIIYDLRPYQLDKIGLANTVRFMIEKVAASSNIAFETHVGDIDRVFPGESEITFYRVVQECVSNVVKHSRAASARVIIERRGGVIGLTVEDDGRGFSPAEGGRLRAGDGVESTASSAHPQSAGPSPQSKGFGLTGLAERVRMLGGQHTITTTPDAGTKIEVTISVPRNHGPGNYGK